MKSLKTINAKFNQHMNNQPGEHHKTKWNTLKFGSNKIY